MNPWLQAAIGLVGGLLLLWLLLIGGLYLAGRKHDDPTRLRDLVRLLHRLARDPSLPRGVRIRLGLLLGYLALPIDLVPDFLPVVGYADDIVIVGFALRSVTRVAGPEALDRHWPGTPDGLRAVKRLAGIDG